MLDRISTNMGQLVIWYMLLQVKDVPIINVEHWYRQSLIQTEQHHLEQYSMVTLVTTIHRQLTSSGGMIANR
jgi:hypothetical protein